MTAIGTYAVECYSPAIDRPAVEDSAALATRATAELREMGAAVEYMGALLVPGDEVVFYLFRSPSPDAVREASDRAGIEFERVLESIAIGLESTSQSRREKP